MTAEESNKILIWMLGVFLAILVAVFTVLGASFLDKFTNLERKIELMDRKIDLLEYKLREEIKNGGSP